MVFLVIRLRQIIKTIGILVLLIVIGLFLQSIGRSSPTSTTVLTQDVRSFACADDAIIRPQDPPVSGPDVEDLQVRLRLLGYLSIPVSGQYDHPTIEAVQQLQRAHHLAPTGIVDSATWRTMAPEDEGWTSSRLPKPKGTVHLEIDLDRVQLRVFDGTQCIGQFPVAVGRWTTPSPIGEFKVVNKGSQGGVFGTRWMGLNVPWGVYGIHGTDRPWSIGNAASAGCIRMFNHDVEKVYEIVPVGTKVFYKGSRPRPPLTASYQVGDVGQDVVYVQWALRSFGYSPGSADARYGKDTQVAVQRLQQDYGLIPSGDIDGNIMSLIGLQ